MSKNKYSDGDSATLYFTQIQLEREIKEIWNEIKIIKNDQTLNPELRDLELVRLFDVYNFLEIEFIRQQEEYMSIFVQSLKLEEIEAKAIAEGKLKAHITRHTARKAGKRAVTYGFYDPGLASTPSSVSLDKYSGGSNASEILVERRVEIKRKLKDLAQKRGLTYREKKEQDELISELHAIDG